MTRTPSSDSFRRVTYVILRYGMLSVAFITQTQIVECINIIQYQISKMMGVKNMNSECSAYVSKTTFIVEKGVDLCLSCDIL